MAVVQSAAAVIPLVAPDAGVVAGSIQSSGAPAIVLMVGAPGSVTTSGGEGTSGVVRQSAAAVILAVGSPGTVTTAGGTVILNRLGGRLLSTGVLGGVLV